MPTMLEYVVKNFYPEIYEAISAPEQEDEVNQRFAIKSIKIFDGLSYSYSILDLKAFG